MPIDFSVLERKPVTIIWTTIFAVILAAFAGSILTHANTLAVADPIIRRFVPNASVEDISRLHILGRKLGHFLIPAGAYLILIVGPLRNRGCTALALCATFAALDEILQTVTPGRTGSIADVLIDMAEALSAFFAYSTIANYRHRAGSRFDCTTL